MSQLNESLLNSIHKFSRTLRQLRVSTDIVFHEFIILKNILRIQKDTNNPIFPSDLSNKLNLSRSYVTAVLNSLEAKHLIIRLIDTEDRRRIRIDITSKGREIFDNMAKKELEQSELLISKLGLEKAEQLINLLEASSKILINGDK